MTVILSISYFKYFHCCVHICNFLVCRSVGSKGRGFFGIKVTSIKHICNIKHQLYHTPLLAHLILYFRSIEGILESRASMLQNAAYTPE